MDACKLTHSADPFLSVVISNLKPALHQDGVTHAGLPCARISYCPLWDGRWNAWSGCRHPGRQRHDGPGPWMLLVCRQLRRIATVIDEGRCLRRSSRGLSYVEPPPPFQEWAGIPIHSLGVSVPILVLFVFLNEPPSTNPIHPCVFLLGGVVWPVCSISFP